MEKTVDQYNYFEAFRNNICNIGNLFDLMALCINYVLKVADKQEFDIFEVLNSPDSDYSEIIVSLDSYMQAKEIDMGYGCLEQLKMYLHSRLSEERKLINQCIQIIMWLDNNCEPEYENDRIYSYKSLNSQFENKIRIIPYMDNRIDRFSKEFSNEKTGQEVFRKDYPVRKVFYNNLVCRYIVLDEGFLEDYDVQIHHLGYENAFVRKTRDKQTLSFAVFPVLNSDIAEYFQINEYGAEKLAYFEIGDMYQRKEESLKRRYKRILKKCSSQNIDFLVFPEMLMTESIFDDLQEYMKQNRITFWGSVWKDMRNQCKVTDGNGKVILSYNKKIGFELKGRRNYFEHLKEKIKKVPYDILDIEGIGRVGVCICRDLTFQEVCNLHSYLGTNILIVPAFSESMDIYVGAEELAKKEKCMVVLANSCSARFHKEHKRNTTKDLGFLVVPAKKGNARSVYRESYGNSACISECTSFCKGILITVDFSNKMEKNGLETIKITKKQLLKK